MRFTVAILLLALALPTWADEPAKHAAPPPSDPAALAATLIKAYGKDTPPEAVRMLTAILRGSQMGPDDGWFGPAETRYTWEWLAKRHGLDPKAKVLPKSKFAGTPELFARLDRNRDGSIGPDDLDWSDNSPYMQMSTMMNRVFRLIDSKRTGKLTREQWQAFFDKAAGGKDELSAEDFRDTILAGYGGGGGGSMPGGGPSQAVLLRGLFAGEIGSLQEGPKVDQAAPNFVLKTVDGKGTIELTKLTGTKPVVLVFGNFTCGPFRSMYPGVEDVYKRHKDKAEFLMVYVREAHPTDGWAMMSNVMAGVAVKQPTTYAERVGAAKQFCTKLNPILPVGVDEISDPVGNAYSGMPARLYVIDTKGKVAYKSGRGPFGFRSGEMEQALVMSLLEQSPPISDAAGRVP